METRVGGALTQGHPTQNSHPRTEPGCVTVVRGRDAPPHLKVIRSLEAAATLDAVPEKLIKVLFRDLVILKKKERTQAPNNNQQLTNLFF